MRTGKIEDCKRANPTQTNVHPAYAWISHHYGLVSMHEANVLQI